MDKARYKAFSKEIEALQGGLSFEEYERVITSKLLDWLSKNEAVLEEFTIRDLAKVIDPIFHPEFTGFTREIFDSYNEVLNIVNNYYADLGIDIARDFGKIRALEKVNRMKLGAYEDWQIRDIARNLRKGIIKGWDHKRIARRIKELGGKAAYYSETLAQTQVKGYSQEAKVEKARIGEVYYYEYVGIIRANTRTFCRNLLERSERTFHIDYILKMKNNNLEPVIRYCGGWKCHHYWEPDPFYQKKMKT